MQSGLWNAKCPACCCFGIKFCEESSNVIQGMLMLRSGHSLSSPKPQAQCSHLKDRCLQERSLIIITIMIVLSSLVSLVAASLVAALPQSLLDPSFDKFFQNSGSFNQQFNQVQQQQLQRPQIIQQQPRPSQQITRPVITSPPNVRYFKVP